MHAEPKAMNVEVDQEGDLKAAVSEVCECLDIMNGE
jgi:hypothetical protein